MNQYFKALLQYPHSTLLFSMLGFILIGISFFVPFVKLPSEGNVFHDVINLSQLIFVVFQKGIFQTILWFLLLFPYLFLIFLPIERFLIQRSYISAQHEKLTFYESAITIYNFVGLFVSVSYVFIGHYFLRYKGLFGFLLGFILLALLLFSFYYFHRLKRLQKMTYSRIIYQMVIGGLLTFYYFFMVYSMILLSNIKLLLGGYSSVIGAIFLMIGLYTYLIQKQTEHPDFFIPLSEEANKRKPPIFSKKEKNATMRNG